MMAQPGGEKLALTMLSKFLKSADESFRKLDGSLLKPVPVEEALGKNRDDLSMPACILSSNEIDAVGVWSTNLTSFTDFVLCQSNAGDEKVLLEQLDELAEVLRSAGLDQLRATDRDSKQILEDELTSVRNNLQTKNASIRSISKKAKTALAAFRAQVPSRPNNR